MIYTLGQLVVNTRTELMGEVLAHLGGPQYRVRYPVVGDEDRDYDIKDEDCRTLRPLTWAEAEHVLYHRYLPGPKEWTVPHDTGVRRMDSTPMHHSATIGGSRLH